MSNQAINEHAYSLACEYQKMCGDLNDSRVMPQNTSEKANMVITWLTRSQFSLLDEECSTRGYPTIVKSSLVQLLIQLAHVGARTYSTM